MLTLSNVVYLRLVFIHRNTCPCVCVCVSIKYTTSTSLRVHIHFFDDTYTFTLAKGFLEVKIPVERELFENSLLLRHRPAPLLHECYIGIKSYKTRQRNTGSISLLLLLLLLLATCRYSITFYGFQHKYTLLNVA